MGRLESVLKELEGPPPRAGERLLGIRAIQVLRRIGSSAARAAHLEIVKGQPESRLVGEAQAALNRARR